MSRCNGAFASRNSDVSMKLWASRYRIALITLTLKSQGDTLRISNMTSRRGANGLG